MKHLFATLTAVFILAAAASAARTLDIYFIDVEGGQSTLIVTPAGQSLLIDTGYPERNGRDPDRIMAPKTSRTRSSRIWRETKTTWRRGSS